MHEDFRAHGATVEINRGMKGEYSIRVVARNDDPVMAGDQALVQLQLMEEALGIASDWHIKDDADLSLTMEGR